MNVEGVIKGKYIELSHEIGIPDGMTILMNIHVVRPTFQEQHKLVDQLCGAWADDPSLSEIFEKIEQQRHRSHPRDVTFDLSS